MIYPLIDAIRAHQWLPALIIAIPLTIGLVKVLLKNTAIAAWAAGLPSWVRWGAANLASGATMFVVLVTQGVPLADAIIGAVLAAIGVEGVFSAQKHARSMVGAKAKGAVVSATLLLLVSGCAGSLEEARLAGLSPQTRAAAPPPSERCQSLDAMRRDWGALGKGAAVLAGAEGIATWPVPGDDSKVALAVGAGVTAAVAATAVYISEGAGDSWARECTQ